jgi:alcohol dehydrogenase class IV
MNLVTLLQPPRVVLGNDCAPQCAEYLAQRGVRRVLLVSSTPVLPTLAPVRDALQKAQLTVVTTTPVDSEPTCARFEQMLAAARRENIEAVLGIGGGSVIDVAKLLAALTRATQPVAEAFGINLLTARALPLVCLPTTSGTGAEVSPNAILLDEAATLKKGVVSPHLVPDAAFIDPLLTLTVPPGVTAATGLDALTHCIEAYANTFAHPAVDVYALAGIRLIAAHLERAVYNGQDLDARAALSLGSYCGGLCLGPVNTGAVHALSYPLGGRFPPLQRARRSSWISPLPAWTRWSRAVSPPPPAKRVTTMSRKPSALHSGARSRALSPRRFTRKRCGFQAWTFRVTRRSSPRSPARRAAA